MRIKHHFCCKNDPRLERALRERSIKADTFSMGLHGDGPEYVAFDLYEDDDRFHEINQMAGTDGVHTFQREYSKEELCAAPWLTVRCFTPTVDLEREEELFRVSQQCSHRAFIGTPIHLRRPINWKKTHFASAYSLGVEHLFCDANAKALLEDAKLPIQFEILRHYRTEEPLDNSYYINILDVLPESAIPLEGIEEKRICRVCGAVHYRIEGTYRLHLREEFLSDRRGICKTPAVFAYGDYYASPMNVISNDLYRYLTDRPERIARNLVFEPVILE